MKYSGAKILIESLLKQGVDTIFGIPGGAVLPIYDELYKYQKAKKIKHILMSHEQGAAHAADAYARIAGKPGVCLATSGPGATNLVTGIATAMLDSVPLIAITGNVSSCLLGKDAFQETDITGVTSPVTKHNFLVTNPKDLALTIKQAFYIASSGRPGAVHIDITKDAQIKKTEFKYPKRLNLPGFKPEPESFKKTDLNQILKLLKTAKRPVIIAGHGIVLSRAFNQLENLVELLDCPLLSTLLGIDSFRQNHPNWIGMVGMHGSASANYLLDRADLVIVLGMRFSDRITGDIKKFESKTKFIHFDIDPAEFNKNVKADVTVPGDLKKSLQALIQALKKIKLKLDLSNWRQEIDDLQSKYQFKEIDAGDLNKRYSKLSKKPHTNSARQSLSNRKLCTPEIISLISYLTDGKSIISTGVGQHQMWVAQYYRFKRAGILATSGGAGTMGYGLPGAVGACLAVKNQDEVWVIDGDGSFQMTLQELSVLAQENLNINIALINDAHLGMVKQWQDMFYKKRLSATELKNPDFVKLANAYGIAARSVLTWKEAIKAVKWARKIKGPVLINFKVNPNQHVYPMVPSGCSLGEQILD